MKTKSGQDRHAQSKAIFCRKMPFRSVKSETPKVSQAASERRDEHQTPGAFKNWCSMPFNHE